MSNECFRIADQLRQAFGGDPWHGSANRQLLAGTRADEASARPLAPAHTIWELVLHIEIYLQMALDAIGGTPMPQLFGSGKDWPEAGAGEREWAAAKRRLLETSERLGRLQETAPGREYSFYYLLHGVVQHSVYHAGQIAMIRRAIRG